MNDIMIKSIGNSRMCVTFKEVGGVYLIKTMLFVLNKIGGDMTRSFTTQNSSIHTVHL